MSQQPTPRKIRSYVRREGRITLAQRRAVQALWPIYGLDYQPGLIDFRRIFGRQAPLVLEIGFGMGASLLQMAQAHCEQDFIGIEVHRPGVGALLQAISQQQLSNIRLFNHDAVEVLKQNIPNESLTKVLILFPDPWPKKRHHKRRLIQPEFVRLLCSKLKVGGVLHLATDWQEYAQHMMQVLTQCSPLVNLAGFEQFVDNPSLRPETKFEKRGKRLGHGVWDLAFKKI